LYEPADVILAVTEDRLVSHVERGENRGRRLTTSTVVRPEFEIRRPESHRIRAGTQHGAASGPDLERGCSL
jgi:hypothetical protein